MTGCGAAFPAASAGAEDFPAGPSPAELSAAAQPLDVSSAAATSPPKTRPR
jgi:hypothetical protein